MPRLVSMLKTQLKARPNSSNISDQCTANFVLWQHSTGTTINSIFQYQMLHHKLRNSLH